MATGTEFEAEELGFTHAWFYDTQMLSADCFVAMGAAAGVGAAAADIGNLDPHFASSTSDRTLVAWIYGGLVRFAPGSTASRTGRSRSPT